MNAVIVLRGEVDGGEFAIGKACRPLLIATEQFVEAEGLALGLEYPIIADLTQLADGAVNGTDQSAFSLVHGPQAGFQGAGKKGVEACIGRRVRFQRFVHIDAIAADEPLHHTIL